jgi:protein MpaA
MHIVFLAFSLLIGTIAVPPAFASASSPAAAMAPAPGMSQKEWCKRLGARLASVTMPLCERSRLVPTGAFSHNGFPILMRAIPSTSPSRQGRPLRILLLGGIHGDELTSVSVVFQWLDLIDTPAARQFHWHIAPVLNPDGLLAPKPQRMNARGVDLNRNFPTPGWDQDAKAYWARKTRSDPRRFPGQAPLSEPESRWLHEEMERFQPDVVISVHAPFGILDFDGPRSPPRQFGRLYLNQLGVYPGSLGNYGGMHKKVPVITIELPNAMSMPPREEVHRIWRDMLAWIGRSLEHEAKARVQRAAETGVIEH